MTSLLTKAVPQEVDLVKTRLRCVDPSNTEIENSAQQSAEVETSADNLSYKAMY